MDSICCPKSLIRCCCCFSSTHSKSDVGLSPRSHSVSKKIQRHVSDSDAEENGDNHSLGYDNAAKDFNDNCSSRGNNSKAASSNQDSSDSKSKHRRPEPVYRQYSLESYPLKNWRPVIKTSIINSLNSESYGSISSLNKYHETKLLKYESTSTRIQSAPNISHNLKFTSLSNIHGIMYSSSALTEFTLLVLQLLKLMMNFHFADEQNKSGTLCNSKLTLASLATQDTPKSGDGALPQISISEYTEVGMIFLHLK